MMMFAKMNNPRYILESEAFAEGCTQKVQICLEKELFNFPLAP